MELKEWNKFKRELLTLMVRLRAGDLRISEADVETMKKADFYLHAIEEVADVPDMVRIFREKNEP